MAQFISVHGIEKFMLNDKVSKKVMSKEIKSTSEIKKTLVIDVGEF